MKIAKLAPNILTPNYIVSLLLLTGLFIPWGVAFGFAMEVKGMLKHYGEPIHESITKKAAIDSGYLEANQKKELKYLLEGVRFNDDPEGYFISGSVADNKGNSVIGFALEFMGSGKHKMSAESNSDATKASHFGDYQYLHAMGAAGKDGSSRRHEIRGKMDRYIYHCVKMATDPDSYRRFGEAYDRVSQMISQEKSPGMEIDGPKYSRDELIVRKSIMLFPRDVLFFHATNQMEFQMRALGSCLHIIQDSYAMGHVVREGWEDGTNNGPIRYFQDYSQQDSEAHAFYDRMASSPLKEIKDFGIPGSNMAYQRTKKILELIKNGCPWTRQGKDDAEEELRDDEVNTESSKMGHCESDQSIYGFIRNTVFSFSKNDDAAGPFDKTQSHPDLVKKPELKQDNLYEGGG